MDESSLPDASYADIRAALLARKEIALLDVREEGPHAQAHPLFAAHFPLSRIELNVYEKLPRRDVPIVTMDDGEGYAETAARRLLALGYGKVSLLEGGISGWKRAGGELFRDLNVPSKAFGEMIEAARLVSSLSPEDSRELTDSQAARTLADRAGVRRSGVADVAAWQRQEYRTTYFFDIRTLEEYESGHLPGFRPATESQLIQETETLIPVRGARVVLSDSDDVRANMSASWLAQMGWEVHVLDEPDAVILNEIGPWRTPLPPLPSMPRVTPRVLAAWLQTPGEATIIDIATSPNYKKGHIPGAWFALRSELADAVRLVPEAKRYVLTCATGLLAYYASAELEKIASGRVLVLDGGNRAWRKAGFELESGFTRMASMTLDRYRRPYEGTGKLLKEMHLYLDWKSKLAKQLERDGTHGFMTVPMLATELLPR